MTIDVSTHASAKATAKNNATENSAACCLKNLARRCTFSIIAGLAIVSAVALQFSDFIGDEMAQEDMVEAPGRYKIIFPQDEESLNRLSEKMMAEAAYKAARIEAAAGTAE